MSETFYGAFYGFDSAPFHITPDPTLLFPTETHRAALGAIEYGISAGKGFIVITGEVGVGKTTVLKVCLDGLDLNKAKLIYLFSPALSTSELYATILDEFDIMLPPTSNAADKLRVLQKTLLAMHECGMQVILAVDEAQHMPEATLESLRILSNLETHKSKLLQIILVGQPELERLLGKHSMRQLAQRIAVRARIKPLGFRESYHYIQHRTRCAGRAMTRPLFTLPALWYLAFTSRGMPRTINICCDNALINGYGHAAERISLSIVRESCKAMKFRPALRRSLAVAMTAMALVGLFFSSDALFRHFFAANATTNTVAVSPVSAAATTTTRSGLTLPSTSALASIPASSQSEQGSQTVEGTDVTSVGAAATETQTLGTPANAETEKPPTYPWNAKSPGKWFVRDGDTVYKACRATYGSCDEKTLRAVFAHNPKIPPSATIHKGDVLTMPDRLGAEKTN